MWTRPAGVKIQAPFGARIQKERFLGLTGPMGRRVLKFDGAFGPEGCGSGSAAVFYAAYGGKSRKPYNRAWGPLEMHPFCLRHLPRRGRFALRLL